MNAQHKRNLTVSEKTLSQLYLKQGFYQQLLKKKVTLSETVDMLIKFQDGLVEIDKNSFKRDFKLEEKPQ